MSDVKGRAREALSRLDERVNKCWEVSGARRPGRAKEYYIEGVDEWSGQRNPVQFGTDRVLAEFFAAAPSPISDLLSLVEELEARTELARTCWNCWFTPVAECPHANTMVCGPTSLDGAGEWHEECTQCGYVIATGLDL